MQIRAEEGIKQLGLQTGAFCGNDVHPKPHIFVVSEVGKWSVVDDGVQFAGQVQQVQEAYRG